MHILNEAIVTNCYIIQCGILNGRTTLETFLHINHSQHCSNFYFTIKVNIANVVRQKSVIYENFTPVFRSTSAFFKNGYLCVCQFSFHIRCV